MTVRGWCPSIHEPMATGDGLLARVKPFGGRLPRAALHAIADASESYGNGIIELTSRGNLQIRGLTEATAPRFAAAMIDNGLADPDPARESRRNVILMPPYDDDLAAEIETVLMNTPGLASKFCIAIGEAAADISIRHCEEPPGDEAIQGQPSARPPRDSGLPPRKARLAMTAANVTVPYTTGALQQALANANGERLPRSQPASPLPHADLMFLPYGRTDAAGLRQLAAATDLVRTTPYRAFYVPGQQPHGARRTIAACPGAPACQSGTTATRADADELAASGIQELHLSGCSKGCAYPHATRTLVARDGRYDLIRHGRANDPPDLTGLTIAQAAAALA